MIRVFLILVTVGAAVTVYCLAGSDAWLNLTAARIIGSTTSAVKSLEYLALGVVLAAVILGASSPHIKDGRLKFGIWVGVILVSAVSAVLSLQGGAVDFASSDQRKELSAYEQKINAKKIKNFESTQDTIHDAYKRKVADCDRYDKWFNCNASESTLTLMSDNINAVLDADLDAKRREKVDIMAAVHEKTGISGYWVQIAIVWARAVGLPFVVAVISAVFSSLLKDLYGELQIKKPAAADRKNGLAASDAAGDKAGSNPPGKPKNAPKRKPKNAPTADQKPHLVVDNDRTSNTPVNTPKSSGARAPAGAGAGAKSNPSNATIYANEQMTKNRGKKHGVAPKSELGLRVRKGTHLNRKYKRNYDDIYNAVRYLVRRKAVLPKHAHIKALGVGTDTATRILGGLRGAGIITRTGNSHELVSLKYINDNDFGKLDYELEKLIKAA